MPKSTSFFSNKMSALKRVFCDLFADAPVKRRKTLKVSRTLTELPIELLCAILDRVPIFDSSALSSPSWCQVAATCRLLRAVVCMQAEHWFLLHCGSQKNTYYQTFLPQLVRTCQHHSMPLVHQLPLVVHATPCIPEGAHYAPPDPDDAKVWPQVWKKAFEDGLSETIIQHLVPQLESTGHNLSINPRYNQTNDGEEYELEGEGAYALLAILTLQSPDTVGVAKAVLHTLSTCTNLIKPNNTFRYNHIGDAICDFVAASPHHVDHDHPVTQAFGRLLTLFRFPLLVRTLLDRSVGDAEDDPIQEQRPVATVAKTMCFLFDTFRRYDAHSAMPPKFCLFKLKFDATTVGKCIEKIAACPDLVQMPYYNDSTKTVLQLCSLPSSTTTPPHWIKYDPLPFLRSPWFELPKEIADVRSIIEMLTDCNSLDGLKHFCSLLPQPRFGHLSWGDMFIEARLHRPVRPNRQFQISKWVSVVSKYRPFHEWEDADILLSHLLRSKQTTYAECRGFLREHFHTTLKGTLSKAMERCRGMARKRQLVTFCSNLLKK
jgi:hypothetical protein